MFRHAYKVAADFTIPVIVSLLYLDGRVECQVGAAVVVNDDGWLLTAAHILEPLSRFHQHQPEVVEQEATVRAILAGPGSQSARDKKIQQITKGSQLIRTCAYWLGIDGWSVPNWLLFPEADLAVGRLDGFDAAQVAGYPTFQTGDVDPGVSLCRLGYPFYEVNATYDDATNQFTFAPNTLPVPRFPSEGILTRVRVNALAITLPVQPSFIETSSAGLRGQSGGPIFDVDGHIWGIQSSTAHLPLGFNPEVGFAGGKRVTEHQFMNVGIGASSETVLAFLHQHGVAVATTAN